MARATFLLPAAKRFGGQKLSAASAAVLGRADRNPATEPGRRAQLLRHVDMPPGPWPIAAMLRELDAGDAGDALWLRVEPAHLRPDINGVRLMAYGDALGVGQADTDALLPALMPLFGDAGFALDAPVAGRWYVRLAPGAKLPTFVDPADALGGDLFDHLDGGPGSGSTEARRWRALLNEAQVVLHNHPWNAQRVARGQLAVNALWPWGGGRRPDDRIDSRCHDAIVFSNDTTLRAIAAGTTGGEPLPARYPGGSDALLFDLEAARDLTLFDRDWLQPALQALGRGEIGLLWLDGGDGNVHVLKRWQRLRFWRRPQFKLAP